ncbi:MAG: outer membrane beta-barrel protein [Gammaproteobacteria bacterium]|nr:outer membrane beta-barrel protein [Gammaproteobacteria bacterium]
MKLRTKVLPYFFVCCLAVNSSAFASSTTTTTQTHRVTHHAHKHVQKHTHKHKYKYGYGKYKGESDYKQLVAPVKSANHFEVIGGLGIAKLNAGNGELGVTSSETDKLVQTNSSSWNTFGAQLGAGYVYYMRGAQQYADHVQYFPSIEPELNLYYLSSNSIKGNVWRFNNSNFNQLTYDIPLHSTRLMLDAALTLASYKRFSVYAIGGIGNAWNRTSYSDVDGANTPCPDQRLSLGSHNNSNFAWEAGAGLTFAFNNRINLSAEYLYTNLGRIKTSGSGNSGLITAPVISPAHFNLKTQTALLALHIAL